MPKIRKRVKKEVVEVKKERRVSPLRKANASKPRSHVRRRGNNNPSVSTRWVKGQCGNPAKVYTHRKNVSMRELKQMSQQSLAEAWNSICHMSRDELKAFALDFANHSIIENTVAKALLRDNAMGELVNTEKVLERIVGKTAIITKSEITGSDGEPLVPAPVNFVGVKVVNSVVEEPDKNEE